MSSTNYRNTFIRVADDCPRTVAEVPVASGRTRSIATLQHQLISAHPYGLTSDDVLFEVFALRHDVTPAERARQRAAFFAKDQPCLRASPLGKRHGWGIHHDEAGMVALVAVESERYRALCQDASVRQLAALRSRRV